MTTNLQDFSTEELSREFLEQFSTHHFATEIEKWFLNASKSLLSFIESAASIEDGNTNSGSVKQIDMYFSELETQLHQAIWNKQDSQKNLLSSIEEAELNFISPSPGLHETICIFDWIHNYSCERFPKEIDGEMIHLLFDVIGISTYCHCDFSLDSTSDLNFNELERLMARTTSFEGTVVRREKNSERWIRIMDFYRGIDGIRIFDGDK